ncbi:MAG: T9SS type A sorting domain-containing protein, partial [Saprospiraceae bacterium]
EWTLSGPGLPPFQNIEMTSSTGAFPNPINASVFTNPGIYTLMFQGICGKDTCKCTLYFKVADTCCNCNLFSQQVLSNVNVTVNHNLCKATVNVGNLPCNGYLANISWGDSQQSTGPFFSGSMPMHNYTLPGQYIITYLAIQLNPLTGAICCEKVVKDTVFLDCTIKDTCECAPFSNEQFYNSSWSGVSFNVTCNQPNTILLPCLKPGQNALFFFHGNQNCNSKNCIKDSVQWNIIEMPLVGSSNNIAGGTIHQFLFPNGTSSHFDITLNQSWFNSTSSYMLVVTGHCGTKVCTCKITFKFRTCPSCPCDSLKVDVSKGFKVIGNVPFVSCKRTFMPIDLCTNDVVNWTVNGVPAGISTGNNSIMINFPGSGFYNVCMFVTRTEIGKVCKSEYCRKVKVKCFINPNLTYCTKDSVGNSIRNGDFQRGVLGELGNGGSMPNWNLFPNAGDGFVIVDDSTGASDDGHLILNGDRGNFAGVWQQVNLSGDDYTIIEYARRNYLGENSPAGTAIEFRLQSDPTLGSPFQVIYRDLIDIADSSAWVYKLQTPKVKADKQMRYLVICLQNSSNEFSVVGIDNLEMCSSSSVNTNQYQLYKNIRIIPNPNFGTFEVELPMHNEIGIKFKINSIDGKLMLEQMTKVGNLKNTIHAEELPSGLYMLQVILENKVIANQKFVKY